MINVAVVVNVSILEELRRIATLVLCCEYSKFASLLFDQGFQIGIPPRIVANVPEPIGTPSDSILH